MSPEQREQIIRLLQKGEELSPEWARILFPPEKREYELVYHGKEREEDVLANTLAVPLQAVRTFGKNGGGDWHNMLSRRPEAIIEMLAAGAFRVSFNVEDQAAGLLNLLQRFKGRMDVADACVVRMSEIFRDCRVFTLDRRDFAIYRRNSRDVIPLLSPER